MTQPHTPKLGKFAQLRLLLSKDFFDNKENQTNKPTNEQTPNPITVYMILPEYIYSSRNRLLLLSLVICYMKLKDRTTFSGNKNFLYSLQFRFRLLHRTPGLKDTE